MRQILHVLTRPDDPLARQLITGQRALAGTQAEVIDLTVPEPDYTALLEKIFAADSVEVW